MPQLTPPLWVLPFMVAICLSSCGISQPRLSPTAASIRANPRAAVIRYAQSECNDACVGMYFNIPDDVMLYDDGRLIVTSLVDGSGWQMKERHLSREQMCAVVNQIRATGYFEFDAQPYLDTFQRFEPRGYVLNQTLEVAADRSRSLAVDPNWFEGLNDFAKADLTPYPWITATRLVTEMAAIGEYQLYEPERVLMWVQDSKTTDIFAPDGFPAEPVVGPIPNFDLVAAVKQRFGSHGIIGTMILTGTEAQAVFSAFDHASLNNKVYVIDGRTFYLSVRALLPDEIAEELNWQQDKDQDFWPKTRIKKPTLSCAH